MRDVERCPDLVETEPSSPRARIVLTRDDLAAEDCRELEVAVLIVVVDAGK